MKSDLSLKIRSFLANHYPASYTTCEIAHRLARNEAEVTSVLCSLLTTSHCVERYRDPIDNVSVWRSTSRNAPNPDSEYPAKSPEDATAAYEREIGHAVLLLQGLGFKMEVE